MPELLLELFSEEIPARMQARAAADLERAVGKALVDAGFAPEGVKAFATPRRLALLATGLPARQPDRREEKKGPRVGAPEKAVAGFLKSAGLTSLDQCEQREDKKGAFYVAVIDRKGRETADVIAKFVPEIIRGFPWPKSMRWGDRDLRWVRPLHSVLCAFNGEIVPFEVDGVASGDHTQGHRFMAPEPIQTRNFEDYAVKLRAAKVVLDSEERKEIIAGDAAILCKAQGLALVEDPALLSEVAGLAEWPVTMIGAFDEKFLTLPDEVLTATMRGHQKYFSVRDPQTGRLANKFVFVANIEAPANAPKDWGAAMRVGYERVLAARLSDAWFLYHQDLKTRLDDRIQGLDKVTFFEGLGSVGDKARRIAALAKEIAPTVGADPARAERAAMLAKADLVSQMVYEFPELQGVMGRYYHLAQSGASAVRDAPDGAPQGEGAGGLHPEEARSAVSKDEDQQIADAIRDHYKPAGQDDDVPTAPISVAVALADKIDTLTAFWAIDKKPTGSSDPFALRRAALGVIEMFLSAQCRLRLEKLISHHYQENLIFHQAPNIRPFHTTLAPGTLLTDLNRPVASDVFVWTPIKSGDSGLAKEVDDDVLIEPEDFIEDDHVFGFESDSEGKFQKRINVAVQVFLDVRFRFVCLSQTRRELLSFFHDRLKVYLKDKGHRYDAIDAVLTDADGNLQDDLVLIVRKLEALEAFLKTDDGENLAAAYKRAVNILNAEKKKDALPDDLSVQAKLLKEPQEKSLFAALATAETKAEKAVKGEEFEIAMTALSQLRAPVDHFFDKVTVNADDEKLRANRLALLARLRAATAKVADFSRLEG